MRRITAMLLSLLFVLAGSSMPYIGVSTAHAQTPIELENEVMRQFELKNHAAALRLIEDHLAKHPTDVNMLYNAACACALLGQSDRAVEFLARAVQSGFIQFDHMENDPDLDSIRDHPRYLALMEARDQINRHHAERQLELAKEYFGEKGYRYETDEHRKLNFATALDEVSYSEMRRMIEKQADHLADTLFDAMPGYFVIIAIPSPADANRLLPDAQVGGMYEHPRRRLISRDIGYLLRHEFTHVMHWGHMERLGQKHPLWVQEGIATLYEDYRFREDGTVEFLPNTRHNIAKRRTASGGAMRWRDLLTLSETDFMRRATHLYPQTRAMLMYVADQGKLHAWYGALVEHFDEDPTGRLAFEKSFDKPLDDIERDWRRWLAAQPLHTDQLRAGDASLGVEVDSDAANDGIVVRRLLPNSGARNILRPGDVIVALDGTPVRSHEELTSALGGRSVGEQVVVRVRRAGRYLELTVPLTRLSLGMRPTEPLPPARIVHHERIAA